MCLFVDYCRIICTVFDWYVYFTCAAMYEMCVSCNLQFVVILMVKMVIMEVLNGVVMNVMKKNHFYTCCIVLR